MSDFRKMTQDIEGDLIKMRREPHRIPEPGFSEEKTAAYVAGYLDRFDFDESVLSKGVRCICALQRPC